MRPPPTVLASVQVLRAVAAWMVVGVHYCGAFPVDHPGWIRTVLTDHGSKGVDIFFVISGLVMGLSASDPELTPREFAVKRIARIVPAYWFYTFVVALLITQVPAWMPRWIYSDELLARSLLFLPPGGGGFPVLTVGWTLEMEMVFYLIVAASLFVRGPQRWLWIAAGIVGWQLLLVPIGLVYAGYHDSMFYEFLMGIVAAHLWRAGALSGPSWRFVVLAVVGVACLALVDEASPPLLRGLDRGAPAFLIMCACLGLEPYFRRAGLLVRMGDHSYSVYLIHTWVLALAYQVHITYKGHGVLVSWCALAAIALLGAASYHLLERPAARLLTRWLLPHRDGRASA